MTAIAAGGGSGGGRFLPFHRNDRSFILVMTMLVWLGIVAGFGSDIFHHFRTHEAAYPLIVHFHAAAFVGWLLFFTTQVGLIRTGHPDLHRKLGLFGAALAAVMIVLGPATAVVADTIDYVAHQHPPTFMAIQLADIAIFAPLIVAGFLARRVPAAHKRLMLLATLQISDAGFARWLGDGVEAWLGKAYVAEFLSLYMVSDLLILGFGAYDVATRGRLHPVYAAAIPYIFGIQLLATYLWLAPGWVPISLHLIGR
jgi:hypothetical protein